MSENWDIHRDMGSRKWFTLQDCFLMDLLAPHLRQAHANAQMFERVSLNWPPSSLAPEAPLTPREAEVGLWMAHGKTNREIALILGISGRTVDKHVEHLLRKLHVENRATAAVHIAGKLRPFPTSGR